MSWHLECDIFFDCPFLLYMSALFQTLAAGVTKQGLSDKYLLYLMPMENRGEGPPAMGSTTSGVPLGALFS